MITSAGRGPVCHIYEASASRKSGIFLSKSVRIGCKYHSKILAGDCGDRSSGDSSGNDRRNRDWSLADFFETQAASWRAFYRNTSDRRSSQFCGSTFADACIWSLAEMAAGQWTGFLEKLHSPGMRSGAVSRLFAGTADRDTSCPGETKRLCTSGADERIEKKTDLVYAHSAAYLDSGAELSGTCKRVSFDRKFCGGEHFYHSGAWQTVCKFHCKPGLYTHSRIDDLYGGSRDPDSAGSGLT